MPELLAAHDVYLLPSLYEPFSIALIEALASGIPTVASDAGGNREIVFHGDTGLIHAAGDSTDLAECVLELLREPELRQTVSSRGRHIGREHILDRMVDGVEKVFETVSYESYPHRRDRVTGKALPKTISHE